MITKDMVEIPLIPHGNNLEQGTERAQKRLTPNEIFKILAAKDIASVEFTKFEINCAPSHLIYEMYNSFSADYVTIGYEQKWIELAVVNAKAFLYYL
ncbi:hypothetical protein DPMN_087813 [Dreissena polymorpha]|uniref:Uncharacterized protein n=1 Tax=Dreissena polymorpha TaxID=45954 RepID=A0A9D4KUP8_DREPO|nr:hypothetical protein DPMN_087813 [Dreissena polymorpha]